MSCYISGLNINRLDLVYQDAQLVTYSNVLNEISYLHQVDSNLESQIVSLSNSLSNVTIDLSPVYSNINHLYQNDSNLNIGYSNNLNSIQNVNTALSNQAIALAVAIQQEANDVLNLNTGYSNLNFAISNLPPVDLTDIYNNLNHLYKNDSNLNIGISNLQYNVSDILVTNSNQQLSINALIYAVSNLPPVDLTNIYDNLNHLYQNDSNLNIGYSNNLNSIQNINGALSNQILKEANDILNLNFGYSNNLNSILNVNTALSNQVLKEADDILNLNTGYSNNNTLITNQILKEANDVLNLNIGYSNNAVATASAMALIQGNAISLNQGYSNNLSSINNLSGLTSNYATLGTLQTLSNKSMDFNSNTFTNFPATSSSNFIYNSNNYYLNDQPLGAIIDYAGSNAPTDWLVCDGSAISRTSYASLFNIIGTTYGIGDGSTTFNIPNLKGRVSAGYDITNSILPFSSTLGATGGSVTEFGSNATNLSGAIVTTTSTGYSLSTTSNIQPTIILNKIIKYTTSALSTQNAINIQNVYNPYWGRVFMNTGYSNLVNGVWTDMPNMQVAYGNAVGSFNTTTNTYTCPVSGLYRMSLGAEFINGLVTNVCWTGLNKNGTTLEVSMSRSVIQENTTVDLNVSDIIELVQGDTIKLQCMVQGNSTTDVKGAAYSQRGEDMTHFSWQLENANTLVTAGSNIYTSMNSNITQTASNLVLFKGSGYELIDGGSIPNFSAYNLKSATTSINVSSATTPSSNQVLTATSASNAEWKTQTIPAGLVYSNGNFTKNLDDAQTTNTYAHGLSVTPKRIVFRAHWTTGGPPQTSWVDLYAIWDSSGTNCIINGSGFSADGAVNTTSYLYLKYINGGNSQNGAVSVDTTNISIVWTKIGLPSTGYGYYYFVFACEG
jgi:microcystin-dependent protein